MVTVLPVYGQLHRALGAYMHAGAGYSPAMHAAAWQALLAAHKPQTLALWCAYLQDHMPQWLNAQYGQGPAPGPKAVRQAMQRGFAKAVGC